MWLSERGREVVSITCVFYVQPEITVKSLSHDYSMRWLSVNYQYTGCVQFESWSGTIFSGWILRGFTQFGVQPHNRLQFSFPSVALPSKYFLKLGCPPPPPPRSRVVTMCTTYFNFQWLFSVCRILRTQFAQTNWSKRPDSFWPSKATLQAY